MVWLGTVLCDIAWDTLVWCGWGHITLMWLGTDLCCAIDDGSV